MAIVGIVGPAQSMCLIASIDKNPCDHMETRVSNFMQLHPFFPLDAHNESPYKDYIDTHKRNDTMRILVNTTQLALVVYTLSLVWIYPTQGGVSFGLGSLGYHHQYTTTEGASE